MLETPVEIARLTPHDWREYKMVRLEALRCEPNAFSSTYAEALTRGDDAWRERLAHPRSILLVARGEGRPVGTVGAFLGTDDGDTSVAVINGMYVAARYRRRGVGRQLLDAIVDCLAARPEIATIRLWVRESEQPARKLYEAAGFRVVGDSGQALAMADREPHELIMERPVSPRRPS